MNIDLERQINVSEQAKSQAETPWMRISVHNYAWVMHYLQKLNLVRLCLVNLSEEILDPILDGADDL